MNYRYRIIILLALVLIIWKLIYYMTDVANTSQTFYTQDDQIDIIKVTVYYEALCPDSKFFIIHQLLPLLEKIPKYVYVDLIPYGKSQTFEIDGMIKFHCQHDEVECFANKIHGCAINSILDPLVQLKYVACMIKDNVLPEQAGERCAQEQGILFDPIIECAKTDKGSLLLKAYGELTHLLSPPARFIPTIELNGSQDFVLQSAILKDLSKSVCQLFKIKPLSCGL